MSKRVITRRKTNPVPQATVSAIEGVAHGQIRPSTRFHGTVCRQALRGQVRARPRRGELVLHPVQEQAHLRSQAASRVFEEDGHMKCSHRFPDCNEIAIVRVTINGESSVICEEHRMAIVKRIDDVTRLFGAGNDNHKAVLIKMLGLIEFEDMPVTQHELPS